MFDDLLLPWQQIYHLSIQYLEQLLKLLANFTLLKYVESLKSYGFLITKELIFGFQILDLKKLLLGLLKRSLILKVMTGSSIAISN